MSDTPDIEILWDSAAGMDFNEHKLPPGIMGESFEVTINMESGIEVEVHFRTADDVNKFYWHINNRVPFDLKRDGNAIYFVVREDCDYT